jgi:hypothetical protein
MKTALAVFAMLACVAASAAEVYRWVDKDGRVHYGDRPRQGAEALDIQSSSGSGVPSEDEQARLSREAECQKKTAQLEGYRKAATIRQTDALGRTTDLSEADRATFISQQEAQVAAACAPPTATP